jgi:hypothetical protein
MRTILSGVTVHFDISTFVSILRIGLGARPAIHSQKRPVHEPRVARSHVKFRFRIFAFNVVGSSVGSLDSKTESGLDSFPELLLGFPFQRLVCLFQLGNDALNVAM